MKINAEKKLKMADPSSTISDRVLLPAPPSPPVRAGAGAMMVSSGGAASMEGRQADEEEGTMLPSAWDSTARAPSMRYLEVVGSRVKYRGPGSDDRDAAAVRSNHPVPSSCPIFYFEVEIVNKGRDGFIGIGFSVADVKLDRLPGWEPHSYGYHGDDGHVFNGKGTGRQYGPCFGTGDWIGVILNRVEGTISYIKNGIELGVAFDNIPDSECLYPTVGFRTPDEEILANFGQSIHYPLRGDFQEVKDKASRRLKEKVLATPFPKARKNQDVLGELVFHYLSHHGHWETATAVARDVLGGCVDVSPTAREESIKLNEISLALGRGDVDLSIAVAEKLAPGVLAASPRVEFALKCQKMCELIRAGHDKEAMVYGREHVAPSCSDSADKSLLDQAVTLFAYSDPLSSPYGYLLGNQRRIELSSMLIRAVRAFLGRREVSPLEDLYRQATAVHSELLSIGEPSASLLKLDDVMSDESN